MSRARFIVADVFDGLRSLPDASVDFACWSPPFLALRSYLPPDHPDKAREIGSEPTPAAWLDVMLAVTAEVGRVLAPHGSIAVEIGDTYAGSGGAGGDYNDGNLRAGQPKFNGSMKYQRTHDPAIGPPIPRVSGTSGAPGGPGWPLPKSLTGLPTLYAWSLAYGRNLLTGEPSPAGQWRVRNLRPWVRPNPPVGSVGDKVRPATSYVTVACRSEKRWHDLDAVRRPTTRYDLGGLRKGNAVSGGDHQREDAGERSNMSGSNPAGAPPRDWQHPVDEIIRAQQATDKRTPRDIRIALERSGWLAPADTYDQSPGGYTGAHYAVWPPELVAPMVEEMCPRRVCRTCGEPSRRVTGAPEYVASDGSGEPVTRHFDGDRTADGANAWSAEGHRTPGVRNAPSVGWTSCEHRDAELWSGDWRAELAEARRCEREARKANKRKDAAAEAGWLRRAAATWARLAALYRGRLDGFHTGPGWCPGVVLDPFCGTGTTLLAATGLGRDAVGVDLDERNAWLARERLGMFLDVEEPSRSVVDVDTGGRL